MTQPNFAVLACYHRQNEGLPGVAEGKAVQETHDQYDNAGVLANRTFTTAAGHRIGPLKPGLYEICVKSNTANTFVSNPMFIAFGNSTVTTGASNVGSPMFPMFNGITQGQGTLVAGAGTILIGGLMMVGHIVIPNDPLRNHVYIQAGGTAGITYGLTIRMMRGLAP